MLNGFLAVVVGICVYFAVFQAGIALLVLAIYCREKKVRCILSAVFAGFLLVFGTAVFGNMAKYVYEDKDYYRSEMIEYFGYPTYEYEPDYNCSYDESSEEELWCRFMGIDMSKAEYQTSYIDFDKQTFDALLNYADNETEIKEDDIEYKYNITMVLGDGTIRKSVWIYQIRDDIYIHFNEHDMGDDHISVYKLDGYLADEVKNAYNQFENSRAD